MDQFLSNLEDPMLYSRHTVDSHILKQRTFPIQTSCGLNVVKSRTLNILWVGAGSGEMRHLCVPIQRVFALKWWGKKMVFIHKCAKR